MKAKLFQILILSIFVDSFIAADDLQMYASAICPGKYQHCRGSARYIAGGGIGYDQGYTTFDGFFAPEPNEKDFMPFLDFRGHLFNDTKVATNVGGGFRKIVRSRIYGANIYYDYRRFAALDFNQLGLGLETLGTRWDVRLNGYIPVGEKINTPYSSEFTNFSGNNMVLLEKYRLLMTGANAEVGVHFGKSELFDFYACAGAYYFHETTDCKPNLYGGKARLSAKFKQYWILEISDSYDRIFKNRFQAQLTLNVPFGAGKNQNSSMSENVCDALFSRMVQPVDRQEIIVIDKKEQCAVAINPETCEPYNFVFVDNQSHSDGTYESPYPTLALAQANSQVGDIIYVFPGDGTTRGMNSGITLKNKQKFWGSGIDHALTTTRGEQVIPAQTDTAPTMTNTNVDTEGDGITLASVNEISGINLAGVTHAAIVGTDVSDVRISDCMIQGTQEFSVNITSSSRSNVIMMDNVLKNNTNGCIFTFNSDAVVSIMNNSVTGTISESEAPFQITSFANPLIASINNNIVSNNETGCLYITLNNTNDAQLNISGNTITNNTTGARSSLGSAFVLSPNNTTTGNCTLNLTNNIFTGNQASCLYCSQGDYANFTVNASGNIMSNNGSGALVFDNACSDTFRLTASNNIITNNNDNGIGMLGGKIMTTANVSLTDNTITNLGNQANAFAIAHAGTTLNFTALRNNLSNNEGSGILMYPSPAITNVTLDIQNNTISNNQNVLSSNATGGIDLEQFTNLLATIKNNTMQNNTGAGLYINSTEATPTACITLTGNNSNTDYTIDSGTGTFNIAPCDASILNTGTINTAGTVTSVQSCPGGASCA